MTEIDIKALVNEYLTHCCDDITDYAREWCEEEHADDMSSEDVDTFADLVEQEVRIWVLLGNPTKKVSDALGR